MTTPAATYPSNRSVPVPAAAGLALLLPVVAVVALWRAEPWVLMWGIAGTLYFALKLITAATVTGVPATKLAAYLLLWPGMDARAFVQVNKAPATPRFGELAWALAKAAAGALACAWATLHAFDERVLLVAWTGMLGMIFLLHFGTLHAISWAWRRAGVNAPPIMRAPIASDSLAALWGGRWNAAFADAAKRLLLKPLAPTLGVKGAGLAIFVVSGLVHEIVISLPARGGWGGPMFYFLVQAAGIAVEKSAAGRRLGLGAGFRGWCWMAVCTLAPLPLLFHAAFRAAVIVPQFQFFHGFLP